MIPDVQINGEVAAAGVAMLAFFKTVATRRMNSLSRAVKKIDRRLGRLENHFGTCTVSKDDVDVDVDVDDDDDKAA